MKRRAFRPGIKTRMTRRILMLVALLGIVLAGDARAEILRLNNGRTMTIDLCRFDGEWAIVTLRNGGEIKMQKDLIDELLPDEVPFAKTVAIEALAASRAANRPQPSVAELFGMVDRIAAQVGVPRALAHAVVRAESNYNPLAVSPKGAMGLMQLMPFVAREYGVRDPFDPEENLVAGLMHLKGLLRRYDRSRALAAYNAGEGAVSRYGGVPPYRETRNYVQRILAMVGDR
jgi:soluble lytic murein transglycosylase-like protein